MPQTIDFSRRAFLAGVAGALAAPRAIAQSGPAPIPVRGLNHFHLIVSDLQRSLDFYQRVLGMPLAGVQGVEADWKKPVVSMLAIGDGPQFISLSQGAGRREGRDRIDHFGFSMDSFHAERVAKMLVAHGIKSNIRMRADSTPPVAELKLTDPENVIVQIQDTRYCGGSGALGDRCSNKPAPIVPGPPPIPVQTLNHFTIAVADVPRAVAFYRRVFGLREQYNQGTEADWSRKVVPVLGFGNGPQFLAFSASKEAGRIDHFCLGVEGFDSADVVKRLADHGIKASVRRRRDSDPPTEELMFRDPDGISVQLQDVAYCGGEGRLGARCR
ncbi:MAG: VOC family protein [Acidimicrobiia bacterium]|nr:VOC family protein [Acidimicrobiia bacterium]